MKTVRDKVLVQTLRQATKKGRVVMPPRAVLLLLLLLVLVAVSGFWLWGRLIEGGAASPVATATMPPARTATLAARGTPTPVQPPPGYRLAGVAVGEPESFAVIEAPNGSTSLYRLHDDVPGLGELIRIEAERVVIRGAAGQFDLWLAPAATATPAPVRTSKPHSLTRTPPLRPQGGGTIHAPRS
jgi:hypothetical protein